MQIYLNLFASFSQAMIKTSFVIRHLSFVFSNKANDK